MLLGNPTLPGGQRWMLPPWMRSHESARRNKTLSATTRNNELCRVHLAWSLVGCCLCKQLVAAVWLQSSLCWILAISGSAFPLSLSMMVCSHTEARCTDWSRDSHQNLQEDVYTMRYEDFMKSSESFDKHVMAAYAARHLGMWVWATGATGDLRARPCLMISVLGMSAAGCSQKAGLL